MNKQTYIEATPEAGKEFVQRQMKGNVIMLNLLKFREVADYSNLESIKPAHEISGEEAYNEYMKHAFPHLKAAGSEILFYGKCSSFLIGLTDETWDAVLLVKHESVSKFLEFARDEGYLKVAVHRTAALEDSRLLPVSEESPEDTIK